MLQAVVRPRIVRATRQKRSLNGTTQFASRQLGRRNLCSHYSSAVHRHHNASNVQKNQISPKQHGRLFRTMRIQSISYAGTFFRRGLHLGTKVAEYRAFRDSLPSGKTIGYVPTMGNLHQGHLDLIRKARKTCDKVVCSIFVNPTQFVDLGLEALTNYPRTLDKDIELLKSEGCDFVFAPSVEEMYKPSHDSFVTLEKLTENCSEAKSRPGFYRGVCTVVSKLFNIVQPDDVFFGQKDGIQCIAVRRMIQDLNFPIRFHAVDTRRHSERGLEGLAMSSRNSFLSKSELAVAPALYQSMVHAQQIFEKSPNVDANQILTAFSKHLQSLATPFKLDYATLSDLETGQDLQELRPTGFKFASPEGNPEKSTGVLLSVAAILGTTRLIDCLVLKTSGQHSDSSKNALPQDLSPPSRGPAAAAPYRLVTLVNKHGARFSPYALRVEGVLKYKNIPYEPVSAKFLEIPSKAAEFGLQLRPNTKPLVPILVLGDNSSMMESRDIISYLERTHPDPSVWNNKTSGDEFESMNMLIQHTLMTPLFPWILLDIWNNQDPENQEYFRKTREIRFGRTLEEHSATATIPNVEQGLRTFGSILNPSGFVLEKFSVVDITAHSWLKFVKLNSSEKFDSVVKDQVKKWYNRVGEIIRSED